MGRHPMDYMDKRTESLLLYLTSDEADELAAVAKYQKTAKARFAVAAIRTAIDGLVTTPESLAASRNEKIMNSGEEPITGCICEHGHTFWINGAWPSLPQICPACGSKMLRKTWCGLATKGFRRSDRR